MKDKLLVAGVVLALVLGTAGLFAPKSVERVIETIVGSSGNQFLNGAYVSAFNSLDSTASADANALLTARQLCTNFVVQLSYATSVQTVTTPTGAQLAADCLDEVEATRTVILLNGSSTSAGNQSLNFVAGTDVVLFRINSASSTAVIRIVGTSTLVAGSAARLTMARVPSSTTPTVLMLFEPFLEK